MKQYIIIFLVGLGLLGFTFSSHGNKNNSDDIIVKCLSDKPFFSSNDELEVTVLLVNNSLKPFFIYENFILIRNIGIDIYDADKRLVRPENNINFDPAYSGMGDYYFLRPQGLIGTSFKIAMNCKADLDEKHRLYMEKGTLIYCLTQGKYTYRAYYSSFEGDYEKDTRWIDLKVYHKKDFRFGTFYSQEGSFEITETSAGPSSTANGHDVITSDIYASSTWDVPGNGLLQVVASSSKQGCPAPLLPRADFINIAGAQPVIISSTCLELHVNSIYRTPAGNLIILGQTGSAQQFSIFAYLDGKVVKVLEDGSYYNPEFMALNNQEGERLIISELEWIKNPKTKESERIPTKARIYEWKEGKYIHIKTVPYKERFK